MLDKRKVAPRLVELMHDLNLTTESLGKISHLSKGTISRYMNGKMAPKSTFIEFIATRFGYNPVWLSGSASAPKFFKHSSPSASHTPPHLMEDSTPYGSPSPPDLRDMLKSGTILFDGVNHPISKEDGELLKNIFLTIAEKNKKK